MGGWPESDRLVTRRLAWRPYTTETPAFRPMLYLLLLIGVLLTAVGVNVLRRPRVDRSFAWSLLIVGVLLALGSLVKLGLELAA